MLDWFHLTMRFTVLNQFAKGFIKTKAEEGDEVIKNLTSAKWYLWHGNVEKALDALEECYFICDGDEVQYKNQGKMLKYLEVGTTLIIIVTLFQTMVNDGVMVKP